MIAVTLGVGADQVLGEPPSAVHPVVWFGRAMARLERRWWRDERGAGVAFCLVGVGGAAVAGALLSRLVGRPAATALATWIAVAGRMLDTEATVVADLVAGGDLTAARRRVRSLVGRDADALDADGIVRATIESVAENTTDAVVAPICWAVVAGAPGVLAYRAVNTLDAMVGHRSPRYERFGWASARLDDVANGVPARVTALAVALARPRAVREIGHAVVADAPAHPSPNSGVAEAAFAGALGVRLGGSSRYEGREEQRGTLGRGRPPVVADVRRAVALRRGVTALVAVGAPMARRR